MQNRFASSGRGHSRQPLGIAAQGILRTPRDTASAAGGRQESNRSGLSNNRDQLSYSSRRDPYDLRGRFCSKHRELFELALAEIQRGRKQNCWSWYIFPVPPRIADGKEQGSSKSREYALRDRPPNGSCGHEAARAYLRFEADGVNLRANYIGIMTAVSEQLEHGVTALDLVGEDDVPKLRASLQLFERISRGGFDDEVNIVCRRALQALGELHSS